MACPGITGQGATLVLSVTGTVGRVRSMQLPTWAMESVDFSALDTATWMCKKPADLTDAGELTAEVIFDTEAALPMTGAIEDATVTFPLQDSANTVPGTFVGSGFLTEVAGPNLDTGEAAVYNLTFTYDGDGTVPAYTAESAT